MIWGNAVVRAIVMLPVCVVLFAVVPGHTPRVWETGTWNGAR